MPDLRAFRVSHRTWGGDFDSVVIATTPSKARHLVASGAQDAGYDVGYVDLRVLRAPEYDGLRFHPAHYANKRWRPDHADRALTDLEPQEA